MRYNSCKEVIDSWNSAFYWNNGEFTVLDEPDGDFHVSASSVAVSGGIVYVGGEYDGRPCYWVNGERHDINCTGGSIAGIAVDSGGRLILAGVCDDEASVWVAGVRSALGIPAAHHGEVSAMTVSGSTVYVSGTCITDDWSEWNPCYWINSVYKSLPEPSSMTSGGTANTYDIVVDGSNVIIAGSYDAAADGAGAGYWRNGLWHDLDGTSARGVSAGGGSICVAGRDAEGACYWLNDQKYSLVAVYSTIATAVASSGSDFVAAGKGGPIGGDDTLVYWSGGEFKEIYEYNIADVNGIAISD